MLRVTTSIVCCSGSVGLNSTLPTDLYRRRDEQPAEGEQDGNGIPTE